MKIIILILSVALLSLYSCKVQKNADQELRLTNFKFESIFGSLHSEPNNMYCLLGTGFFRAPSSDNSDSLINNWMQNHPQAIVIPVSSFGPLETNKPDSKMTYCWIVDQNDTLNNYLIRKGCFPGGTMMKPDNSKRMIAKKDYKMFIEQIKSAELFAREQKNGIWKED